VVAMSLPPSNTTSPTNGCGSLMMSLKAISRVTWSRACWEMAEAHPANTQIAINPKLAINNRFTLPPDNRYENNLLETSSR
jgi:hypothetical protein